MDVVHSVSYYVVMASAILRLFVCGCLCITFCKVLGVLALNFLIKHSPFCLLIIVLLQLLFVDCHVFASTTVLFLGWGLGVWWGGDSRMLYSENL